MMNKINRTKKEYESLGARRIEYMFSDMEWATQIVTLGGKTPIDFEKLFGEHSFIYTRKHQEHRKLYVWTLGFKGSTYIIFTAKGYGANVESTETNRNIIREFVSKLAEKI